MKKTSSNQPIDTNVLLYLPHSYFRKTSFKHRFNMNSNNNEHDEHNAWSTIPKIGGQQMGK